MTHRLADTDAAHRALSGNRGYVLSFGEGGSSDPVVLGRGANLKQIIALGLPTLPGFTVTARACAAYHACGHMAEVVRSELLDALGALERQTGTALGDPERPLIMVLSMATTADTAIFGLTDETIASVAAKLTPEVGWRLYAHSLTRYAQLSGLSTEEVDPRSDVSRSRAAVRRLRTAIEQHTGQSLGHPVDTLHRGLVEIWRRAAPPAAPVALTVHRAAFLGAGDVVGDGIAYTRDPVTGAPGTYGTFRPGPQWKPLAPLAVEQPIAALRDAAPSAYETLESALPLVEAYHGDMCAIEFAVGSEQLSILGTQPGPRRAASAARIAVELVDEGLILRETALERVPLGALEELQDQWANSPLSPWVSRLVGWLDEDEAVPIRAAGPPGLHVVRTADDLRCPQGTAVLLAPSERPMQAVLERLAALAVEKGIGPIALQAPDRFLDDLRLPLAHWIMVVGPPDSWATRLLAIRAHRASLGR